MNATTRAWELSVRSLGLTSAVARLVTFALTSAPTPDGSWAGAPLAIAPFACTANRAATVASRVTVTCLAPPCGVCVYEPSRRDAALGAAASYDALRLNPADGAADDRTDARVRQGRLD